jgi:Fic family protein
MTSARSSSLIPQLVDELFKTPGITIGWAASVLGVTHRAATLNVTKLVDAGVLTEIPSTGRTRVFLAQEILRTIKGDQQA